MTVLSRRTLLAAVPPLLMTACAHRPAPAPQQAHAFSLPGRALPLRAWVALPAGYDEQPARRWPLVVFLHGSGERGDELARVKVHGPPRHVDAGRAYPFILVSPQLEAGAGWDAQHLHLLLAELQRRWRVDGQRVSATGLSLGGKGVWDWAAAHPGDLAAIAPVCGWGDPAAVCRARAVPARAYHGDADTVVPLAAQRAAVDALRACGGRADFIVYPGVGHDAWNPAYDDPALVPWLMAQARA